MEIPSISQFVEYWDNLPAHPSSSKKSSKNSRQSLASLRGVQVGFVVPGFGT